METYNIFLELIQNSFLVQRKATNESKKERKKKLFNSVFGLILIYILYNLPYFTNTENIIKVFTFNWMPNIATWFFITMACVKILCFNLDKRKGIALLITSIAIITWMHYAFLDNQNYLLKSVCMALPFYVIGYLCNKYLPPYLQVYATISKKIHIIGFVVLLVTFLLFLSNYIGRVDMYTGTYKYSMIAYILIALAGCCIPFGIAKCLTLQHAFIYYTSRCTGFIVGTHMIVCSLLTRLHLNDTFLQGLICSVIMLFAYYPFCKIVYTRFPFLIGKIKFIK